jgi:hypothetical protein
LFAQNREVVCTEQGIVTSEQAISARVRAEAGSFSGSSGGSCGAAR